LEEGGIIPDEAKILLVSTDLQARVRLEAALGAQVVTRRPQQSPGELRPELVVLDLDQLGAEDAARWAEAVRAQASPRVVGFFSHVDEGLGDHARELGIETFRRGRFWRSAREILAAPGEPAS